METAHIIQIIASVILVVTVAVIWIQGNRTLCLMKELQEGQFKEAEQARQRDRRQKWLDDIAAWTRRVLEAITRSSSSAAASSIGTPRSRQTRLFLVFELANDQSLLSATMASRGEMIVFASHFSEHFSDDLRAAVQHLADDMQALADLNVGLFDILVSGTPDALDRFKAAAPEQDDYLLRVYNSAATALREISKIKIQDIDAS